MNQVKKVRLLSGGNPQIAKADGDEAIQSYIAAMPGWKKGAGMQIDALVTAAVPKVRKAVRWNSPFYGVENQGWFLSFHCMTNYIKVTFFNGAQLKPPPPESSKDKEARYFHIREGVWDEQQFGRWVKQASRLPGWDGVSSSGGMSRGDSSTHRLQFAAKLIRLTDEAEYYGLEVPKGITRKIGEIVAVPVTARVNDSSPFQASLYPLGGGRHGMRIKASIRTEMGLKEGDRVRVEIEVQNRSDRAAIPEDLRSALSSRGLYQAFEAMPPGMRNFTLRKIEEAAKPATRQKRIEEAVSAAEARKEKRSKKGTE